MLFKWEKRPTLSHRHFVIRFTIFVVVWFALWFACLHIYRLMFRLWIWAFQFIFCSYHVQCNASDALLPDNNHTINLTTATENKMKRGLRVLYLMRTIHCCIHFRCGFASIRVRQMWNQIKRECSKCLFGVPTTVVAFCIFVSGFSKWVLHHEYIKRTIKIKRVSTKYSRSNNKNNNNNKL